MVHAKSRAQRRAAFLERAVQMFDALEDWYDEHPDASFGEIEAEARRQRRELMGQALAILINGRERGFQLKRLGARSAVSPWSSRGIVAGASMG